MTELDELFSELAATIPEPSREARSQAAARLRTAIHETSTRPEPTAPRSRSPRTRRWMIAAAIAALIAVATGSAAALGVFSGDVHTAFAPGAGCPSDISKPKRAATVTLPSGNTFQLWVAFERQHGQVQGFCTAVLSDPGKEIFPGKPYHPGAGWMGAADIDVRDGRPTGWVDASGAGAWADDAGEIYSMDWGVAGDASTVKFQLANGEVLPAAVGGGFYLLVAPYARLYPGFQIIARDAADSVIGTAKRKCDPPYVIGSNRPGHYGLSC